jgi:hypothetical protein
MEPLRTTVEQVEVALLKAETPLGLQQQIDLYTNQVGIEDINNLIVKITFNSWYDEGKKCMIYFAAVLWKFIPPRYIRPGVR